MGFPDSSVGRIDRRAVLAAVDLPALADSLLGPRRGQRSPVWPCPDRAHDPASSSPPEISVFTTRDGGQRWHCPNCGSDGTAIDLVMKRKGLGFREAAGFLLSQSGPGQHARPKDPSGEQPRKAGAEPRPGSQLGLHAWSIRASSNLWESNGSHVRRWLTDERGLPDDLLRLHRVGATALTPDGDLTVDEVAEGHRSASPAAVLPVFSRGQVVCAQIRFVDASVGPAPLVEDPTGTGLVPPVGLFRPVYQRHPEIIVASGILDALSANAASYRSAALLGPGFRDTSVALALARLRGPLVLALGTDPTKEAATDRLSELLWSQGRRPALLAEMGRDLNQGLVEASNWPRKLASHVQLAVTAGPRDVVPEL